MTCEMQAAGTIELYFYGELPLGERAAVQTHLKQCLDCRQALEDLSVIRAALASRPDVATPPGGDWSGFMTRLNAAIERTPTDSPVEADGHSRRVLRLPQRHRLAPYLAMAALLALVTMSVLFVFRQRDTTVPIGPGGAAPAAEPAAAARAEPDPLVSLSDAHFERSKLVVLGLTTKDSANSASDWSFERELASTLLSDTRLYRLAAEQRGMNRLAGVMRDLELVLLQTSMSEQPDTAALEQLQRLIRRRDLVTKMNVMSTGMNAVPTGGP
jgi:hypothetical protein